MDERTMRLLMKLPLKKSFFDTMFDVKKEAIGPVLAHYNVDEQTLHDMLWEEYNISGMENRIANTAFDFLITACEQGKDLPETLKGAVKENILAAAIYYTNIAPDTVHTSEFKEACNGGQQ